MRPEDVEQWTGQGKYSIPSPALDCIHFATIARAANLKVRALQVDVLPLQTGEFSTSEAGHHCRDPHRALRLLGRFEDLLRLVGGERLAPLLLAFYWNHQPGSV